MDTLANTPIFTEHLAFKADIQNDWTLCIKFPISELCRQLILLDAGSNYSVIRDFDADNWSCCTLDQITLQIEVCFWNRQLILPFYAGSNYSVLRGLMQTIDPVAYWIKLFYIFQHFSKFTNFIKIFLFCFDYLCKIIGNRPRLTPLKWATVGLSGCLVFPYLVAVSEHLSKFTNLLIILVFRDRMVQIYWAPCINVYQPWGCQMFRHIPVHS